MSGVGAVRRRFLVLEKGKKGDCCSRIADAP